MDLMPWQAVVFISIPEAFLLNLMGLTLVGIRPDLKKLGIVAVLQALCSYFIRALPIVYGVHMVLQLFTTFIIIKLVLKYKWTTVLLGVLIGFVVFTGIIDPLYVPMLVRFVPLNEIMTNAWLRVAASAPEQIIMLIIVLVCRKFGFKVLNVSS
jgi:two-component system sensor histidine kinase AgrC